MSNLKAEFHSAIWKAKNQPHQFYEPIGRVEDFINMVGSGEYLATILSAANGIGKTWAGVNILAHLFWPVDNKYFDAKLFRQWSYPKKGRIVSDPNTIIETIIPTLKDLFPKGRYQTPKYEYTKEGKRYESYWKTDTGWEFSVMTYEQEVKEFESATLGFVWFDEPPPEAIYKANVARLRKGGIIYITQTPLSGSAWLYDRFFGEKKEGEPIGAIEADVEEACEVHGTRGFLKHDDIMRMISQYSDEDKQARIFGKFQHLTGLVYKKFTDDIHIVRPFAINEEDYAVYEFLDPHPRNPDAVTWIAVNRKGEKYICDELYINVNSADELASRIRKIEPQYRIIKRMADPSAWVEDQHKDPYQKSLANQLNDLGLEFQPASKNRTMGVMLTRDALDYQIASIEGEKKIIKPPMLYVFDTCLRHIWEFKHWQYSEWTGKTAEKRDRSEKPQDKDDHMMENVGRAFLDGCEFVPYTRPPELTPEMMQQQSEEATKLDPYA